MIRNEYKLTEKHIVRISCMWMAWTIKYLFNAHAHDHAHPHDPDPDPDHDHDWSW